MQVQITHVPATAAVVSLGNVNQHPILRESPGQSWRKICDYLLIEEAADDCKIILVELKSSLQKRSEGLEQLRRSLPLAKYLLSVCEVELQRCWIEEFKYALIAEKSTNYFDKQRIRPHAYAKSPKKEKYEGIEVSVGVGTRFEFAALAA